MFTNRPRKNLQMPDSLQRVVTPRQAIELGSQAIAAIAGSDWIVREARLREQFAEILLSAGDLDRARVELETSASLLAEKGYTVAETRVRDRLAALA